MPAVSFTVVHATLYIQETSSQLDSVSQSADADLISLAQNCEFVINNKVNQYITCDGLVKYFEGPQDYTIKIGKIVARGELLSALIGSDSLAANVYNVTKYTQFLPRLSFHLKLLESANQEMNITLQNCIVSSGSISVKEKELVLQNVEIAGEGLGAITWKQVG